MSEIKTFEFTSVLGWSVSRYEKFTTCKRQYFYDYYAKFDSEFSTKKIYELKKMTTIPLETGNIVHDVIKTLLKRLLVTEEMINKERFFDYTYRKTKEYCTKEFQETYYQEIDSVDVDFIFNNAKASLENFLNSKRFLWLTKESVKNKKEWIIEPDGYGETRIDNLKAYCKVDFLFPIEKKYYILDWKTGKKYPRKHEKQLVGYSAWASYHFDTSPSEIIPLIAYLQPEYDEIEVSVNEFDIQEFAESIKQETQNMYKLLSSVKENIPLEKEKFDQTQNQKICSFCNYREICDRL